MDTKDKVPALLPFRRFFRAEDNIQVCNLTTPCQYFHVLRRQMKRDFKKPLIAAPKSLFRDKRAVSEWTDFESGSFQEIIDGSGKPEDTEQLILCSSKVYYDLVSIEN